MNVNIVVKVTFIPTQTIEMFNYDIMPNNVKEYYKTLTNYDFISETNRQGITYHNLTTLLTKNKETKDNFLYKHHVPDILKIKNNYIISGLKDGRTTLSQLYNSEVDKIIDVEFKKEIWSELLLEKINEIINEKRREKINIDLKFYILMKDENTIFINNKGETYSYELFKRNFTDSLYIYEPYIPLKFDTLPKREIVDLFKELYNILNSKKPFKYKKEIVDYHKIMFLYNYDKLEDEFDTLKVNNTTIYSLKGCFFFTNEIIPEKLQEYYDVKIPIIGTLELINKNKNLYKFKITSLKDQTLNPDVNIIDSLLIYITKKWNFLSYVYKIKNKIDYTGDKTIELKDKGDIYEYDNTALRNGILSSKKLHRDYEKDLELFYIPKYYTIDNNKFKKLYNEPNSTLEGIKIFSDINNLNTYINTIDLNKQQEELSDQNIKKSINELIKIIMKNNDIFYIRKINEEVKNKNYYYKYNILYKNIEKIDDIIKKPKETTDIYKLKYIENKYKEYFNPTTLQNIKLKNVDYLVCIKLDLFKKNTNLKVDCKYTYKNIKKYFKRSILTGGHTKKRIKSSKKYKTLKH